jgi:hypothetical protein
MRKKLLGIAAALLVAGAAHAERTEVERSAVLSATDCIAKQTLGLWNLDVAHGRDQSDKPGWGNAATSEQKKALQLLITTILSTATLDLPTSLRRFTGACQAQITALVKIYDHFHGKGTGQTFLSGPYREDLPRAVWERIKEHFTDQSAAAEEDRSCRGLLTANWTESVANDAPDDGSRLIRADEINSSCLFQKDSDVGKQILAACRMGFGCEVKARVNGDSSDVYYIVKVYSAKSTHAEAGRRRGK